MTPLYYCFPNSELAKLYLRYSADPKLLSFLHCFFTYRPNLKYLGDIVLTEFKLDVEEEDVEGKSALIFTYEEFKVDQMIFLLNFGANIDRPSCGGGRTMLLDACMRGHSKSVEFLLNHGASSEVICTRGKTIHEYIKLPYMSKSKVEEDEIMRVLYKHTLREPAK